MLIGTDYFVSLASAIEYYAAYGFSVRDVAGKLKSGEIDLGKPPNLKPGESLVLMDKGRRYGIEDGKPYRVGQYAIVGAP